MTSSFASKTYALLRFGGYAVDHVSFTFRAGEVIGVYGLISAPVRNCCECLAGRRDATGRVYVNDELLDDNRVIAGSGRGSCSRGVVGRRWSRPVAVG